MKIIKTILMLTTMVAAQDLIEDTDGNLYEVWDTDLTIMLQEVTTGKTLEFNKESDVKSSNYNRRAFEDHRQIWQNFAKRAKLEATGLFESPDEISRLRNQTQSDTLDMSRRRIRQDKPR